MECHEWGEDIVGDGRHLGSRQPCHTQQLAQWHAVAELPYHPRLSFGPDLSCGQEAGGTEAEHLYETVGQDLAQLVGSLREASGYPKNTVSTHGQPRPGPPSIAQQGE
jgi:hypothetical protein